MGKEVIRIVCYADDIILMTETDDLQQILHRFNQTAQKYNMQIISISKTKGTTISKEQLRKLALEDEITEQVM